MTAGAKTYLTILKSAFRSAMSGLDRGDVGLGGGLQFVNVRPDGNDVRPDGNDVGLGGDGIVEGFGQGVDNSLGLAGLHACGFKLAEGFQGVENSRAHDALRCLELNTHSLPFCEGTEILGRTRAKTRPTVALPYRKLGRLVFRQSWAANCRAWVSSSAVIWVLILSFHPKDPWSPPKAPRLIQA